MGVTVFPAAGGGGGIKSVQRGLASGAGTVTITAINTGKSFVNIYGTTSSGNVAASFNLSAAASGNTTIAGNVQQGLNNTSGGINLCFFPTGANKLNTAQTSSPGNNNLVMDTWLYTSAVNAANYNVGGGSNNLVAAVVQGYLSGSTSLEVSGACRWEVVEFN